MRLSVIFATLFLFAIAAAQTPADPRLFFAQIIRHQGAPTAPNRDTLTHGVLTGDRHVVAPASFIAGFASEPQRGELRVYLQSTQFQTSPDIRQVEEVFIHPNFNAANPDLNNIAVLRLSSSVLDTVEVVPRNLGALTPVACTIYGFAGWEPTLESTAVTVSNTGCRTGNAFCTTFTFTPFNCGGYIGTPVVCANQDYVAGIANSEITCTPGQPASITFTNIEPFAQWINEVSSARSTAQISFIVLALGVVLGKFVL